MTIYEPLYTYCMSIETIYLHPTSLLGVPSGTTHLTYRRNICFRYNLSQNCYRRKYLGMNALWYSFYAPHVYLKVGQDYPIIAIRHFIQCYSFFFYLQYDTYDLHDYSVFHTKVSAQRYFHDIITQHSCYFHTSVTYTTIPQPYGFTHWRHEPP